MNACIIEGILYNRYRIRFRLNDGKRKQRTFLSVGMPWLSSEITKILNDIEDVSTTYPVIIERR